MSGFSRPTSLNLIIIFPRAPHSGGVYGAMSLVITYTFILKSAFGNQIGVYKHPLPLYTKMNQTFIYFENISIIEVKEYENKSINTYN